MPQDRSPKGICVYCIAHGRTQQDALIKWNEDAGYKITGYKEDRKGGGTHHVLDEEVVDGQIWHNRHRTDCFSHRHDHLRGEQPELFAP